MESSDEEAALLAKLSSLTDLTVGEWKDLLSLPTDQQTFALQGYQELGKIGWAQKPDVLGKVLSVLGVLGAIAGAVGGVAGAASAVAGLRNL